MQIFDNLYFIGTNAAAIYVVNSPDGMAMIDTNFDWDAKQLVLELKDFGLDLSAYADVKAQAENIHSRLLDGSMPCDEPWPKERIAVFKQWIDDGMAP